MSHAQVTLVKLLCRSPKNTHEQCAESAGPNIPTLKHAEHPRARTFLGKNRRVGSFFSRFATRKDASSAFRTYLREDKPHFLQNRRLSLSEQQPSIAHSCQTSHFLASGHDFFQTSRRTALPRPPANKKRAGARLTRRIYAAAARRNATQPRRASAIPPPNSSGPRSPT